MKYYLFIVLTCLCFLGRAQVAPTQPPIQTAYGTLTFNTPFYDLENHWAVATKNAQNNKCIFGMVYLDMQAGFSFRVEGTFSIDAQGHAYRDSSDYPKTPNIMIVRINAGTKLLCAIPDAMVADLHVKPTPDWLANYHPANQDRNSVAFKVTYGKFLNGAGGAAKALDYLESAYKTDPHAAGLEFELSYTYNVLGRYDKAIAVLQSAMANAPDNPLFYSELGFSYLQNKDNDNTIKTYVKGISLAKQRNDGVTRIGMTTNLSLLYVQLQQFDKAEALINDYITDAPNNVSLYILLATTYSKAGDFDNAIKTFTKAIDVASPQDMEIKAQLAWDIALIYRDKKQDSEDYAIWGKKAKAWAPVNSRTATALRSFTF